MNPLVLYYSYSGNTRKVAERIAQQTGGHIAAIEVETPYPASYKAVVQQGEREVKAGFAPRIKPLAVNIDDYDTVIIGTPVWWYTFAPPLKTALAGYNWAGKTVYPFATHGGGPGQTLAHIAAACKGAAAKPGLDIYFSASNMRIGQDELDAWIRTIG